MSNCNCKCNRTGCLDIILWFVAFLLILGFIGSITGCAITYNPDNARPTIRDIAGMTPANINCPDGSTMFCNVEGGGLVGKTYNNCQCRR